MIACFAAIGLGGLLALAFTIPCRRTKSRTPRRKSRRLSRRCRPRGAFCSLAHRYRYVAYTCFHLDERALQLLPRCLLLPPPSLLLSSLDARMTSKNSTSCATLSTPVFWVNSHPSSVCSRSPSTLATAQAPRPTRSAKLPLVLKRYRIAALGGRDCAWDRF